jgi:hypothetical protein
VCVCVCVCVCVYVRPGAVASMGKRISVTMQLWTGCGEQRMMCLHALYLLEVPTAQLGRPLCNECPKAVLKRGEEGRNWAKLRGL